MRRIAGIFTIGTMSILLLVSCFDTKTNKKLEFARAIIEASSLSVRMKDKANYDISSDNGTSNVNEAAANVSSVVRETTSAFTGTGFDISNTITSDSTCETEMDYTMTIEDYYFNGAFIFGKLTGSLLVQHATCGNYIMDISHIGVVNVPVGEYVGSYKFHSGCIITLADNIVQFSYNGTVEINGRSYDLD